jgi:orotate phosphoribosyltransferase
MSGDRTDDYRSEFVRFLLDQGALIFGDFTLKSGRKSPYMVNTGKFDTGSSLETLGVFYAKAVEGAVASGLISAEPDIFFGSAYKGIPLAASAAMAYADRSSREMRYLYNRKEAKDHGEAGMLIGRQPVPGEKLIIVDDVITAGTALTLSVELLQREAPGTQVIGSIVAVDRLEQDRPGSGVSAVEAAAAKLGFPVFSIVTAADIIAALLSDGREEYKAAAQVMTQHIQEFGIK